MMFPGAIAVALLLLSQLGQRVAATTGPPPGPNEVTIDLSRLSSPITHQGSGILYGFSADASLPPAKYSKAVGLKYYRGGGGHSAPGWEQDQGAGFDKLWAAAEAMVLRAHGEGAKAIVILCDLWSGDLPHPFDNGAGRTIPGDNGEWALYDSFIDAITGKVMAMPPAVRASIQFEIWNEPARGFFWRGNDELAWQQYLQMWSRGFKRLRTALPSSVVVGPSIWGGADPVSAPGNRTAVQGLFNQWLDETKANNTFPDVLSWHVLYDSFEGDYNPSPRWEVPRLRAALKERGLNSSVKLMINEYGGDKAQLGPSSAAWWIANLERYDIAGCRSIECSCCTDPNLSCMLTKQGDGFATTSIFDVYAAYASMSGHLATVAVASETQTAPFDGVASLDPEGAAAAWVLLGQAQNETGPYSSTPFTVKARVGGLDASPASALVKGGKVNVTVSGSVGPSSPQTMVVNSEGTVELALDMGGPHANAWYFVKLEAP